MHIAIAMHIPNIMPNEFLTVVLLLLKVVVIISQRFV